MHRIIKKILFISSFIFIVFTLTSCIRIGPNEIILPKKKQIYKSLNDYLEITVPKIDEVLYYYYYYYWIFSKSYILQMPRMRCHDSMETIKCKALSKLREKIIVLALLIFP